MALCWAPASGASINPQFGKEYQILLETSLGTPYFFNHHQRYDESPDGICIGAKGSGKSVWANLQAHHLLSRYDPWVLILDGQGGSFRALTEYHGGRYYDLSVDGKWPFTLNPFHLPDSSLTRQHLSMLIRTCCVVGGFVPNAEKNQIIYDEICRVMDLPKDRRQFSALKLPKPIALYLSPWVENGQYSFVFDNEVDTFALKRLQTIDFSAINSYPDVLQPLLFHFFHLWDRVIDNDSLLSFPKQMIFDEAWKLLNFQPAREYMEKAGRTWRKRNGCNCFFRSRLWN
jgi:type IV secretory pathway VirB4 component